MVEECTLITFYSDPKEAFLTSILRVLEAVKKTAEVLRSIGKQVHTAKV